MPTDIVVGACVALVVPGVVVVAVAGVVVGQLLQSTGHVFRTKTPTSPSSTHSRCWKMYALPQTASSSAPLQIPGTYAAVAVDVVAVFVTVVAVVVVEVVHRLHSNGHTLCTSRARTPSPSQSVSRKFACPHTADSDAPLQTPGLYVVVVAVVVEAVVVVVTVFDVTVVDVVVVVVVVSVAVVLEMVVVVVVVDGQTSHLNPKRYTS